MSEKHSQLTPLMKQYFQFKDQYQEYLLLFQVGDFYELFFDDAKKASAFLGITLTKRGNVNGDPIPLCGVPLHAVNNYLPKLVNAGFKVVVCNQLEEAVPGKVVKRGISQVLTPGTLTDSKLLEDKSASYLFSFFPIMDSWGMLFGEILTAQLFATFVPAQSYKTLESELSRFFPDEILIPNNKLSREFESYFKKLGYFYSLEDIEKYPEIQQKAQDWIKNQFSDHVIKTILENNSLKFALYNFYFYLSKNQTESLEQFKNLSFYKTEDFLILDSATQKNLELIKNNHDNSYKHTLFEVLDKSCTPMGSRTIKKWIVRPLIKYEAIIQRQNAVNILVTSFIEKEKIMFFLSEIGDIERVIGRIALKRATLNDYLILSNALDWIPKIKTILKQFNTVELFSIIEANLLDFEILKNLLNSSINKDLSKSWIIKEGFNFNLDRLRELSENANKKILDLENKEQLSSGISSLKIRYNQVHGYYIEVTKANLHLVPSYYIRHQTLLGKERFITQELQELYLEIERSRTEVSSLEVAIFENIKKEVETYVSLLRRTSNALAHLDAIVGFANAAYNNGYIKPEFNQNRDIIIEDGRHPIIEKIVGNYFVPNNTFLIDSESCWIITGPNMGGKSTYLRQVALICIMAQCGSFIPAKKASLPILDRIFTRIGAGDYLAEGKSTFLIEMEETATICNQATSKSLVILDEVGRGTSTFDGLAIAQAVIEHIYIKINARCLFATHYHELTKLEKDFNSIAAYYAASKKTENGIIFLHKIVKGTADGSFGIEVAKLANLPKDIINRANQVLQNLILEKPVIKITKFNDNDIEFNNNKILFSKLSQIDFEELSPKKAFDILYEIKDLL